MTAAVLTACFRNTWLFLLCCFLIRQGLLCSSPTWTGACCVDQTGLKLASGFLLLPPGSWGYRGVLWHLAGLSCFAADLKVRYYCKIYHHPLQQPTHWVLEVVGISNTRGDTLRGFDGAHISALFLGLSSSVQDVRHSFTFSVSVHTVTLSLTRASHILGPFTQIFPVPPLTIWSLLF